MTRTGKDGPTDRAWPAAVVLGLALVAGASMVGLAPAVRCRSEAPSSSTCSSSSAAPTRL